MIDRRLFMKLSSAAGLVAVNPSLAFASAPTENRLVYVVLRGGLDSLHAVVPYADPTYYKLRPNLALGVPGKENGVLDLNGVFGLHPALAPLHNLYKKGEMLIIPAASTRYRQRSHFDGQNMLENGSGIPFGAKDGWLNRAIAQLDQNERRLGLALGPSVPLLLQGSAPVSTWADSPLPKTDEDFLNRLTFSYRSDPLFSRILAEAKGSMSTSLKNSMGGRTPRRKEFETAAKAAAQLLARKDGPRIAVMESQGWDTHFGQDWRLARLFEQLSAGLVALKTGLGSHWRATVVVVVSEFGRTAAENGSRGTDHGVGCVALLLGGAVKGGIAAGDWPGLSQRSLFEGRDIRPTTDYESIFKTTLIERLGFDQAVVEDKIFPNSREIAPIENLFTTG